MLAAALNELHRGGIDTDLRDELTANATTISVAVGCD